MAKAWTGAGLILVLAWLVVPVTRAESVPEAQRTTVEQGREAPRSSRLRFRSGPICMCSNGLGEAEIEAAERERLESIVEPREAGRR